VALRPVRNPRSHLSYANVTASLALFVALGGTSYAVMRVDSRDVVDNSLRSRDIRNHALLGKDFRSNSVGGGAVRESGLGRVPRARDSERVGGKTATQLTMACVSGMTAEAGVCFEATPRPAEGFLTSANVCHEAGRSLPSFEQLDPYVRRRGPLSPEGEWTSSVYLAGSPPTPDFERLEAIVLKGPALVDHARVNAPNPHPFRCVALPSN
jgi:hypothetical protein